MKKLNTVELRTIEAGFIYGFLDIDLNNGTISISSDATKSKYGFKYWITLCLKPGAHDLKLCEDNDGTPGEELLGLRTIFGIVNKLFPSLFQKGWL